MHLNSHHLQGALAKTSNERISRIIGAPFAQQSTPRHPGAPNGVTRSSVHSKRHLSTFIHRITRPRLNFRHQRWRQIDRIRPAPGFDRTVVFKNRLVREFRWLVAGFRHVPADVLDLAPWRVTGVLGQVTSVRRGVLVEGPSPRVGPLGLTEGREGSKEVVRCCCLFLSG